MPEESIDDILQHPARKLVVAEAEIDLTTDNKNDIFILLVEESRGSAGGRAAGSGVRKINKVIRYSCSNGMCIKSFETENTVSIELFDIPYSAVALDIKLFQGKQIVVQGIVDPDLVASYVSHLGNTK
jgi:hypothetical protein